MNEMTKSKNKLFTRDIDAIIYLKPNLLSESHLQSATAQRE